MGIHNPQFKEEQAHKGQKKSTKGETTIYKTLHSKQKIEQH